LILAQELRNHQTNCQTILLDGHFCLLNKASEIQDVPLETFKAIAPFAIIVVTDNPEKISERLAFRDNHIHTIESIEYLQSREIDRANFISQSLDVPIEFIRSSENLEVSLAKVGLHFMHEEN
jgi:adenylate kinase